MVEVLQPRLRINADFHIQESFNRRYVPTYKGRARPLSPLT